MKDFHSCFGESGVQVADSKAAAHNLVTCLYQAQLRTPRPSSVIISITWSKTLMGQCLSIGIDDPLSNHSLCSKLDIKPWLFSKMRGSKNLEAGNSKVHVFWDLSAAKFGSGPEPSEGYYVAVLFDLEIVLLLGDMTTEAYRKTTASPPLANAAFISKREHIFGKKVYCTKAQFCDNGQAHDIAIECQTIGHKGPILEIRIDRKRVMQVKRLEWKFRGNQTILVDGLPVEVFWDVHNWLFGTPVGNAVFMFQTCVSSEKLLPWSCSHLQGETHLRALGFSLILYAWKTE